MLDDAKTLADLRLPPANRLEALFASCIGVAMIALSDEQLSTIFRHASPLPPSDREEFLRRVAEMLQGVVIGDGVVSRICREVQRQFFKAPASTHDRKSVLRQTSLARSAASFE